MEKKTFVHVIDNFKPDENLKYRIKRKVENEMKKKEKSNIRTGRKIAAFSACLAAVMGLTIAMPVMAENIPALQNLISKIEEQNETNPTKDYAEKVQPVITDSVASEPEPFNKNDEFMSVYVDSYYCDKNNLYITYGIQGNDDALSKCNCIFGAMNIKINGHTLESENKSANIFTASSDELGTYIGFINVDVSEIENIENARVDIDFNVNTAFDSINYNFNYDTLCYEQFRVDDKRYLNDTVSFGFDISTTEFVSDTYEVNQTQGENIIKSVTVSPTGTEIDMDIQDGYSVLLKDSTGKELNWNSDIENTKWETPMVNAEFIEIMLYEDKNDTTPTYTFKIPIERGYNFDETQGCYIETEPVYNPPIEEVMDLIKADAQKKTDEIAVPLGTDSGDILSHADLKINLNSCTASKSFENMIIDSKTSSYHHIDNNGNIENGYHALIIEATVENLSDEYVNFYKQFTVEGMDNAGLYYSDSPLAFDDGNYIINLAPHEKRTFKIGYTISDDVDKYNFPLVCNYSLGGDSSYTVKIN